MKRNTILLLFSLIVTAISAQTVVIDHNKAYKNAMLFTGLDTIYYQNTHLIKSIAKYRKGLKNGNEVLFHKNGQKKAERVWKSGLKHGLWINWDDKGNKTAEAHYKNNLKEGRWLIWDENALKLYEMHYRKGKKVGKWLQWNENGDLIMEKEFD